jgi:hypothetical protein
MDINEAVLICEGFAKKHDIKFERKGECGFGRDCVGFLNKAGTNYIDFNPTDHGNYEPIKGLQCEACYPPPTVKAYHKHDCLAVLGHEDSAIIQLATWVQSMEKAGDVRVVEYPTGANGLQAVISGTLGYCVLAGSEIE